MNMGWRTAKIRMSVYNDIAKAVPKVKTRNVQKYSSVSDFVNTACIELLDREGIKVEATC
jgi:hypothetical protein